MKTKEALSNAFYNLALKHTPEQITVEMIVNESGLSKATFYRHFSDKYDLMNYFYKVFFESFNFDKENESWHQLIKSTLVFMKDNRVFFTNIIRTSGQNCFRDYLMSYHRDFTAKTYLARSGKTELSYEEDMAVLYTCSGSTAIMEEWFRTGLKQSVDEVTDAMYNCIPPLIAEYL